MWKRVVRRRICENNVRFLAGLLVHGADYGLIRVVLEVTEAEIQLLGLDGRY